MLKSRNTTAKITGRAKLAPIHPGAILKENARRLGYQHEPAVPGVARTGQSHLRDCRRERSITGETALRFARYFNTTPGY